MMILSTYVKRSGFYNFVKVCKLLNEMLKIKFKKFHFRL